MSFDFSDKAGPLDWSRKIRAIMDEMLRRHFVGFRAQDAWRPATNVYETPVAYCICVDLAGLNPDDVDVECIEGRRIRIQGVRRTPSHSCPGGLRSVHVMEIDEGPFRRDIELPEVVRVSKIEANYSQGFLWITVPRDAA